MVFQPFGSCEQIACLFCSTILKLLVFVSQNSLTNYLSWYYPSGSILIDTCLINRKLTTGTRHPSDVPCTYRGMYLSSYKRYDPCTFLGWTDLDKNSNISSTRNVYTKDVRDSYILYIPRMYERVVSSMYKYVSY